MTEAAVPSYDYAVLVVVMSLALSWPTIGLLLADSAARDDPTAVFSRRPKPAPRLVITTRSGRRIFVLSQAGIVTSDAGQPANPSAHAANMLPTCAQSHRSI